MEIATPLVTAMFPGVTTPVPLAKTPVRLEELPAEIEVEFAAKLVMTGSECVTMLTELEQPVRTANPAPRNNNSADGRINLFIVSPRILHAYELCVRSFYMCRPLLCFMVARVAFATVDQSLRKSRQLANALSRRVPGSIFEAQPNWWSASEVAVSSVITCRGGHPCLDQIRR